MTNTPSAINLAEKLGQFDEHWAPRIIANVNDVEIKLAKLHGEFVWHAHAEADELFYVLSGELCMNFRDRSVIVGPGELIVVPAGVEHQPVAESEVQVVLVEPTGTLNTGDAGGPLTQPIGS